MLKAYGRTSIGGLELGTACGIRGWAEDGQIGCRLTGADARCWSAHQQVQRPYADELWAEGRQR